MSWDATSTLGGWLSLHFRICSSNRCLTCFVESGRRADVRHGCWPLGKKGLVKYMGVSWCFLKWWYPQNTPKWSFSVGKPMVVGYHHFRKPPYIHEDLVIFCLFHEVSMKQNHRGIESCYTPHCFMSVFFVLFSKDLPKNFRTVFLNHPSFRKYQTIFKFRKFYIFDHRICSTLRSHFCLYMLLSPLTLGTSSPFLPLTVTPCRCGPRVKPTGAQSDPRPWIGGLVAMAARSRSPKARGDAAEASGLSLKARKLYKAFVGFKSWMWTLNDHLFRSSFLFLCTQ